MAQPVAPYGWYNPLRFFNLAIEGVKTTPTLPNHQPGIREKLGNGLLYGFENAPHLVEKIITNPDVIVTAITIAALWGNSMWHYPTETKEVVEAGIKLIGLRNITWDQINRTRIFVQWATGTTGILGLGLRAGGRLATQDYINRLYLHYANQAPVVPAQPAQPAAPKLQPQD